MHAPLPEFADISMPVPLDRSFTYRLPVSLRHRIQAGCRVIAPFARRKLMGVVIALHSNPPETECKEVLRLVDEQPVFNAEMLALANWVSEYYCAPLGEVLRGMVPLGGEARKGAVYSLTGDGRDLIRQSVLGLDTESPDQQILRLLDERPRNETWLKQRVPGAASHLTRLAKKGLVVREQFILEKDPLRMAASRLLVEGLQTPPPLEIDGRKLPKAERELLSFLALHPGEHLVSELEDLLKNASTAARSLARKNLLRVRPRPLLPTGLGTRHSSSAESPSAGSTRRHRRSAANWQLSFLPAAGRHRFRQDRGLHARH
jgi:primosomal protein N' (replication factor Y) (superfamily II helicase)